MSRRSMELDFEFEPEFFCIVIQSAVICAGSCHYVWSTDYAMPFNMSLKTYAFAIRDGLGAATDWIFNDWFILVDKDTLNHV